MACHFVLRTVRVVAPIVLIVAVSSAQAATKDVRMMMDWLVQGTHAPFIAADAKGYFKDEGLNVQIDSGKGATNVAVSVASGTYQFGLVDLPAMVNFDAHNPATPLIAVYMYFGRTPLAIISRRSAAIRTPKDLDGKKIAGGPGTAAYDTIGLLVKPSDHVTIHWVPVQPQLFAPLLLRGQVDGLSGFVNSMLPAAVQAGFKESDLATLRYSQFGVNSYGLALVTTKALAQSDPDLVKRVVKAVNRALVETKASPEAALQYLLARDPLLNPDIERLRLKLALELIDTPDAEKYGLGSATPERLQSTVDSVMAWDGVPKSKAPPISEDYTAAFLPPLAERR